MNTAVEQSHYDAELRSTLNTLKGARSMIAFGIFDRFSREQRIQFQREVEGRGHHVEIRGTDVIFTAAKK